MRGQNILKSKIKMLAKKYENCCLDRQVFLFGFLIPVCPDHTAPGYFIGYLTFEQEPKIPGVHEITVTIHLRDGRVLSRTIEKVFE